MLNLQDLSLNIQGKCVFQSLELTLNPADMHILLGPNGAGKSSLLKVIAGHPNYAPTQGRILINDEDITKASPEKRAQAGIFVAFQNPCEIEGLSVANFLRTALKAFPENPASQWSATEFYQQLYRLLEQVGLPKAFTARSVHCRFSGGEKKRLELLQLLLFKPKFALLDELDSGLDIDARKLVAQTIKTLQQQEQMSFLVISHDIDFIRTLNPTAIHILKDGKLITEKIDNLDKIKSQGFCEV